ncbi:Occlusion-derived virus envelope protein E66 [Frankliniella fusca]|uniref:Occlusion-derived virus envelope protein E66 n=1 Tax=Frankliniella fusca TaxID=407009 RepID=A0AAE1LTH3_9NEOP|nr:Occlusion-derived virus envelope protein E66 [Frankliniella fusca]
MSTDNTGAMASNTTGQYLYGIYLEDLEYFSLHHAFPKEFHPGDLIFARRTITARPECAVVLGFGPTKPRAKSMANAYMREVGKHHDVKNLDSLELGETQLI